MGPSSDEDELNVVDDDFEPRKVKSAASTASHADHSNVSTTPQSNDESIAERPKRASETTLKRSRTQKRHLNDNGVTEKRLIEKLTQENQRLKTELESRSQHHQQQFQGPLNLSQSVIVGGPKANASTSLAHPTPAANSLPFFGFSHSASSVTAPTTQIQSSGSAFSVPQTSSRSSIDPPAFSLFYPPSTFGQHNSLLSLFGNGNSNNQYDMASLSNLHAILQQQQRQQSLFPNFATNTTSSSTSSSSANPEPLTQLLPGQDPLLSIFHNTPSSVFTNFRGAVTNNQSLDSVGNEQAMRFGSVFNSNLNQQPPNEEAPSTSKKKVETSKHHKSKKGGPSPENLEAKGVSRGPGNLQFINQLPTAHEPRASVLVHTDQTIQAPPDPSNWTSEQRSRKSPPQKREKTSPRSASAFSALPEHNPNGQSLNGNSQQVGERPHSLLGSLLASSSARRSPSVPESRTEKQSGLVDQQQQLLQRLEQTPQQQKPTGCLTSLAVSLHGQPISQNGVCGRSDNDSMGSPHSTRSTTDSNRSHGSPSLGSHGQDGGDATQTSSTNEGPLDKRLEHERYMDRRRRNNEAAKRCRANRRAVFEYRSKRAQQLEAENSDLRQEMIKLNSELEHLKAVIAANNRLVQT